MAGDPARLVDWRVWAKTDQLYIREYEQETNLRGYLYLDTSRSMAYGDGAQNKMAYARLLCAVLALLMQNQNDAPARVYRPDRLRGSRTGDTAKQPGDHLHALLDRLARTEADGEADDLGQFADCSRWAVSGGLRAAVGRVFSRTTGPRLLHPIQRTRPRGFILHVLHRDEVDPQFEDDALFVDSETGAEIEADSRAMRAG